MSEQSQLRPDLTEMPFRMRDLPIDPKNHFPVPWFVAKLPDGTWDHRVADQEKLIQALVCDLCWLCGYRLGAFKAFVIGPMCAITGTSSEPPNHLDCARWAVQNCPFLSRPKAHRRDNLPEGAFDAPGMGLKRNPGVSMIWITRKFELFRDQNKRPLVRIGDPHEVEFWSEGRPATRAEIEESVRTGLPAIEELARQDPDTVGAFEELGRRQRALERLMPAA